MQITKINWPALRKPRGWSEGGERGGLLCRTAFSHQWNPCCLWAPWNLSVRATSTRNLSSDLEGSEAFPSSLLCGKAKGCPEVLGSGRKYTSASYGHLPVSWKITDFCQTPKPETEHWSMGAGHPQPRRERERILLARCGPVMFRVRYCSDCKTRPVYQVTVHPKCLLSLWNTGRMSSSRSKVLLYFLVWNLTGTMFARGLKRKSAEEGEDADGGVAGLRAAPSYTLQRQSLLDMSLVKLQLCHMLVEPNLCRSVLIANTVRQIQEEMTQDGTWRVAAPQTAGRAPLDRLVSTEILCRSGREQEGEGDGPSPGQAPRRPQSSPWGVDGSRESRGGFQKSLDQIFETLENKTPGSVEELFSDVDSPYYDLDAVLTGMVGGAPSGPGLPAFAPAAAAPPSSSCRSDLGELEHAVEILVET